MVSFRSIPSTDGFTKRYGLHYHPKKMSIDRNEVLAQYGCINFHAKHYRGHGAKLTLVVKKWVAGWTWEWFYCNVPLLRSPSLIRGKIVYALRSSMASLDFSTYPSFECMDNDFGDLAFIHAIGLIGSRDVEQYLAYGMFPLSANCSFTYIADGEAPILMVTMLVPEFPLAKLQGDNNDHFLARVELSAKNVVGSYSHVEHDVCVQALPNRGWLNRVFENAGVAYGPRPEPGSEASTEATKKKRLMLCPTSGEVDEGCWDKKWLRHRWVLLR
jgi:hypothetical protein